MSNLSQFQREVFNKQDWSSRDWIRFTDILYNDITQDARLLPIKNRLAYEFRVPNYKEVYTILEVIKTTYTNNNDIVYIETFLRQGTANRVFNLNRLLQNLQPVDVTPPIIESEVFIVQYNLSLSNKFVDIYFNGAVYGAGSTAVLAAALQISNLVIGGVTAINIAGIKKANHHLLASAGALVGGESVIRVFLTLTGTPTSTETFKISVVADSIYDVEGIVLPVNSTDNISLNITPFTLWDAEEVSTITVTGLGISAMADVMGNINLAQATDADRPRHYLNSVAQFDRTQTEWLSGATHANFAKQSTGDFAIVVKDLRSNLTTNSGGILSYMVTSNNAGWMFRGGGAALGVNMYFSDNVSNRLPVSANHEDQVRNYIVQNESGVLTIYDETNTVIATSSTALGAVNYTGVNGIFVGRRDFIANNEFNGEWAKLLYYNQALSSTARANVFKNMSGNKSNVIGTITKYLFPLVNGSVNSSAKDTMQVFLGDVLIKDGIQHLFYVGNAADGDVDRVFKATRPDDNSNTPFTKLLDGGLPKVILDRSNVNGTYDENQVFCRDVIWDAEANHAKMYFTAEQTGASPMYVTALAISTDPNLETWVKQGQIYADGSNSIILQTVVKIAPGVYHAVVSKTAVGVGGETNAFSYDHLTSVNGVNWSAPVSINSLFKNTVLFMKLLYFNNKFYGILNGNDRDTNLGASVDVVIYEISADFTSSIYLGKLFSVDPGERALGVPAILQKADYIEIFYSYVRNQDKANSDGGEGFSAIRRAVLTGTQLRQSTVVKQYPSWVKRYYPLDDTNIIDNKFVELITGIQSATYSTPQWVVDGRRFLDVLTSGPVWTDSYADLDLTNITISLKAEIVATGTIIMYRKGTDVLIQQVNQFLEVWLNNGQIRYITSAVVAMPTGITEFGNRVRMGFSLVGGVVKLIVGNNTNVTVVKTVDNPITTLTNTTNTIEVAPSSIVEIRSILVMSGQTDQQWIDTDL
jgi:hypothetical protein